LYTTLFGINEMSSVFIEVGYLPCMMARRTSVQYISAAAPVLHKEEVSFDSSDDEDSSDNDYEEKSVRQTCGPTKYSTVAAAISAYVSNIKSV
jgi:hypothetical protein